MSTRILIPDGTLVRVPDEKLAEAIERGGQVMNPEKMRELRQAVFMEHGIFKDAHTRPTKRKRKSLVRSSR